MDVSLENHYHAVMKTATDFYDALEMLEMLQEHIEHRLKQGAPTSGAHIP